GITGSGTEVIPKRQQHDHAPLSFAQERLWFVEKLNPVSGIYNIPLALRLTGDLNIEALEFALTEIVRRHEVLRTRYETRDHQPVQVVEMQFTRKLPVLDLSNVSGDKLETELKHIINEEADLSFDLSQTPIMRARLLRLGDNEHVFLLTLHHIAGDGWS